jgi:outer membrane protein TolC
MLHGPALSFGQPPSIGTAPATQRYEPPAGIQLEKTLEQAVSSDDFEKFISTGPAAVNAPLVPAIEPPKTEVPAPVAIESPVTVPVLQPADALHPPQVPLVHDPLATAQEQSPLVKHLPYWQEAAQQVWIAADASQGCQVELEQLIWLSTQYSPKVQSLLILPQIQRTEIGIAQGEFDPRRFARTNYGNTSDPVGNTLTTGGPSRLIDDDWQNKVGLRKRNTVGGKAELSQAINTKDSNSLFFRPNNQADTRLSLNYTHPLLRGAGYDYNTSAIQIAGIKTQGAIAGVNRELQGHALDIIDNYWDLTLQRYFLIQAHKGRERLAKIKQQLENRAEKDLLPIHLHRVRGALAQQEAKIRSSAATIQGLQATLKSLVNAPDLWATACTELIPMTTPDFDSNAISLEDELCSAILHRWDVVAIQQSIEAAVVEKRVATNELKPQLDLFTESYIRGLKGDNEIGRSWTSMFDEGRPSFFAGAEYLAPVGNRSAKANLKGRELEVRKLLWDYKQALLKAQGEITLASRESDSAFELMQGSIQTTLASLEEVHGYYAKFEDYLGDNPSVSSTLNELIDAENRLINSENIWAQYHIDYIKALFRVKYQAGTLMTVTAE